MGVTETLGTCLWNVDGATAAGAGALAAEYGWDKTSGTAGCGVCTETDAGIGAGAGARGS